MFVALQTIWSGGCASDWVQTLDRVIAETEAAEFDLATKGSVECRQKSGSYYTPHDVADHFWLQFFRFHKIGDADSFRSFCAGVQFVEPSAGSGIFVFTLLNHALKFGLEPEELKSIRFTVIDVNFSALQFIKNKIVEIEKSLGIDLSNIGLIQSDFLEWVKDFQYNSVVFVGNPPFVSNPPCTSLRIGNKRGVSNPQGSAWRNLYADFLLSMIEYRSKRKSISLILPVSICFSRDYLELRKFIFESGLSISAASYDNIPDSLFKAGKPESQNTNRANSQRCTILHLGGPESSVRESSSLKRWSARERISVLSGIPDYQSFSQYQFDGQIPRPSNPWILEYLSKNARAVTTRSLMSRHGHSEYSIAAVCRNFIGIRETACRDSTSIAIRADSDLSQFVLLQVFSSQVFYEYWRTLGDGFHVTNDLIERFPISQNLFDYCISNVNNARVLWNNRLNYLKQKLNSGKVTRTFDFSGLFDEGQF